MRQVLQDPFADKLRLQAAIKLASDIYRLHENGQDYSSEISQLSILAGQSISKFSVDSAFGSINPEAFARELICDLKAIPTDLTPDEMLELISRIITADGNTFQMWYWLQCLKVNTGDDKFSNLIYWPGEYFKDGNNARKMSSQEILDTALNAGKKCRT